MLGRVVDAGLALLLGRELLGLAGRALLPDERPVADGRVVCGRVACGRAVCRPVDRVDVLLLTPSVLREELLLTPELLPELRVTAVRVEIRPLASREIAVRVALRVEAREVRVFIRSRDDERAAMWRLFTMMVPG